MKWNKLIFYLGVLFLISIILIALDSSNFDCGSSYFYVLQNGNRSAYSIIYLLIFTLAILDDFHQNSLNKFDRLMITRVGYKTHLRRNLIRVFYTGALFNLIINICVLLYIHMFRKAINFQEEVPIFLAFSGNQGINLFAYLFCSFIGNGILAIFGYSLIDYFHNKYTYRFFLVILMLLGVIFIAIIQPAFLMIIGNSIIKKVILVFFLPVGLFSPGMIFEELGYLNFFTTAVVYSLVSYLLLYHTNKKRKCNG